MSRKPARGCRGYTANPGARLAAPEAPNGFMDLNHLTDLLFHTKEFLENLIREYQGWTYLILFVIVFCETGLVVTPFLPGDSLLFATGAIAAGGALRVELLMLVFVAAALCGDNVNYWIGRYIGPKVFQREDSRWLRKKHLERTHQYFEKYGGKTIIIARFVPIVRTFTPFVAGVGSMSYLRFLQFSLIGAPLWVFVCVMSGYWFGRLPFVSKHFELVILGIIAVSLIPVIVEFIRARRQMKREGAAGGADS
jgi:membrane-associated protein